MNCEQSLTYLPFLKRSDPELFELLELEKLRQENVLRLIPSENYVSRAVMEATGSILTNKYSEGYPGKRYYQGQEFIDRMELLGIERAKSLFNAEHANIQPYSGSIAVLAAYFAFAEPGDTIMGLSLAHGGHLSHGHSVNISGKLFRSVQYGVSQETERMDYAEILKLALESHPKVILCGGTAYPRIIHFDKFAEIARQVGAFLIADVSHIAGLIAAGQHPQPFPHVDAMVTTSHKTLRGPRGAMILCKKEHASRVDRAVFPLFQGGPHQHTQAGITTALREAMQPEFKTYGERIVVNCAVLAESLKNHGFRIISGGTDTHLMLVDVTTKGINGKAAAVLLEKCGIVCNFNMIPFDTGSAKSPSGIRLGTPALTTRGMGRVEMKLIANSILEAVENRDSDVRLSEIRQKVEDLCRSFPVPDVFVADV